MSGRTILLVDEDKDTRIILDVVLRNNGYETVEAENGEVAFLVAHQRTIDLIILNYPMPDETGKPLVRRLRESEPTRHIPVLNITSRVVPHFLSQAEADGVTMSVSKPMDVTNVLQIVAQLIARPAVMIG
ncbi:MAG TPA: response regulator [Longimicrobiales bacterium]|nr:response regulator [Longimicrobiales bacterium]